MTTRVRGRDYRTGLAVDLTVEGKAVTRTVPAVGPSSGAIGGDDLWLAPGLVDIQVNGFGGHEFNGPTVTPAGVESAIRALWRAGVTVSCPTVCTDSFAQMSSSLRAIARARVESSLVRRAVACIHIEGPYIASDDGPRGAHPKQHVRNPDWDEFSRLQEAADGGIGYVTLAPELPGAVDFTRRAVAQGVMVGLGHHAGSKADIDAAVAAGATISTHLGNGAHAMIPRHPNYIWEQLANDDLNASIIVDGHHLPPAVVKCFVRSKGIGRLVLVSDAVSVADLPPGRYETIGMKVELSPSGRISLLGTPYLAGSALALCQGLAKAVAFAGVSLADAVTMATRNSARLVGAETALGGLDAGDTATLIVFRWKPGQPEVTLVATLVEGEVAYAAQ